MALNQFERKALCELSLRALEDRVRMLHQESNIQRGLDTLKYMSEYINGCMLKDGKPVDLDTLARYVETIKEKLTTYFPE